MCRGPGYTQPEACGLALSGSLSLVGPAAQAGDLVALNLSDYTVTVLRGMVGPGPVPLSWAATLGPSES